MLFVTIVFLFSSITTVIVNSFSIASCQDKPVDFPTQHGTLNYNAFRGSACNLQSFLPSTYTGELYIETMSTKFSCIVAVCENRGIGIKGDLPWKLKQELKYFSRTTKKVDDAGKRNAVIMGRKTYFGVPESKRPLPDRLNIVLTRNASSHAFPPDVLVCGSLQEALVKLDTTNYGKDIENIWVVGGNSVYKEAMESNRCHRVYLTEIKKQFECDAFFPEMPKSFVLVDNDPDIPNDVQEENGIQYMYKIYENKH